MPRSRLSKVDASTRVYKLINELDKENYLKEHKEVARKYLFKVLDVFDEYMY